MECQGINLMNTSYLYARFTQTVLCAQMVQESIAPCGLNQQDAYDSPLILMWLMIQTSCVCEYLCGFRDQRGDDCYDP